jgi:hypothetical protein|nr:MAG TPA: hypothetical protein [Caudoviricetes sp.]
MTAELQKKKEEIYLNVLKQLNETFDSENFDEETLTNKVYSSSEELNLKKPSFTFKRYLYKGDRLYVKLPLFWEGDVPKVGTEILDWGYSLTTMISWGETSTEKEDGLNKWKVEMRMKGINPDEYSQERADYGTLMHYTFSLLLNDFEFNKESFEKDLYSKALEDKVLRKTRLVFIIEKYRVHLWNALIGFCKFVSDFGVTPIATELVVMDKNYLAATPIDLLCVIKEPVKIKVLVPTGEVYLRDGKNGVKKGDPKMKEKIFIVPQEKLAIIDFKSGTKGFYDSYYYQLNWGSHMLKETYGIEVETLFNYSPKDEMSTKYKIKKQTDNEKLDTLLPFVKETSCLHLMDKFKNGIDIFNDNLDKSKVITMKSISYNSQKEDYKIVGDEVVLEDGYSFNYKDILEKNGFTTDTEGEEGEQ